MNTDALLQELRDKLASLTKQNQALQTKNLSLKKENKTLITEINNTEKEIGDAQKTLYIANNPLTTEYPRSTLNTMPKEEDKTHYTIEEGYTKEIIEVEYL